MEFLKHILARVGQYESKDIISQLSFNLDQGKTNSSTSKSQLRGGGCITTSKINNKTPQIFRKLPLNYVIKMKQNCRILIDKSDQQLDPFQRDEIMMSLQWFQDNRIWIYEICKNDDYTKMVYDAAKNCFTQLISKILIYLKGSGCICYYVLEVCNDFLLIIYTYLVKKGIQGQDRQIQVISLIELLPIVDLIQQDLEVHQNFWINGLNFQITLIKIVLININKNYQKLICEGIKLASSGIQSLITLTITGDFTSNLFNFAKFVFNEKYNQYTFPIQTYEIYYYLFLLKWSIIRNIQEGNNINDQITKLKYGYNKQISKSHNWIVHYCWIHAFSDLISYRQLISKTDQFKNLELVRKNYLWNQLIKSNFIQLLSYDKSMAKVNNNISFDSIDPQSAEILIDSGVERIKLFQKRLLEEKFICEQGFFQFYIDFSFEKAQKKKIEDQVSQQHQLLYTNDQLYALENLNQLLIGLIDTIEKQQNAFQNSFFSLSKSKDDKNNFQPNKEKFEESTKQLTGNLFKFLYFLFELNVLIIIEKNRLIICKNYLVKKQEGSTENTNENQNDKKGNKDKKGKNNNYQEKLKKFQNYENKIDYLYEEIWLQTIFEKIPDYYTNFFNFMNQFKEKVYKTLNTEEQKEFENKMKEQFSDSFICKTQKIVDQFVEYFQKFQSELQQHIQTVEIQNDDSQIDKKIQADLISFIKIKDKYFKEDEYFNIKFDLAQKFETIEVIQPYQINIQYQIMNMEIFKRYLIQKVYILAKLHTNMSIQLNINAKKPEQQNFNSKEQHSKLGDKVDLIQKQQKDLESLFKELQRDENVFQKMLKLVEKTTNQIKQNSWNQQSDKALGLQVQIYNELHNLMLSSKQDIDQCNKLKLPSQQDIYQCEKNIYNYYVQYHQYNQDKNNIQQQISAQKSADYEEDLKQFSQKIKELNELIKQVKFFIEDLHDVSQLIDLNLSYLEKVEKNNQKNSLDIFNQKIEQTLKKVNFHKQLQKISEDFKKIDGQISFFQSRNLSFDDFASIFCYNSKLFNFTTEKEGHYTEIEKALKETDEDYKILLDSLYEQEIIVERKFLDINKDYIVRECFFFHLIKIYSQVPEKDIQLDCQEYIKRLWLIEKDESVRALLKNKEIVEMQKLLFSPDLKSFSNSIKEEMNQKLKQMEEFEQKIRFEGNLSNKERLQQQLTIQYEEFEEFLANITEMSQQLDISLIFLKEIQKNIKQLKQKIDDLQESLKQIGNDIRKLRGKNYQELLQIRKDKVVTQASIIELDSVYITLKTEEIDPKTGEIKKSLQGSDQSDLLIEDIKGNNKDNKSEGEVNQFIYDEQETDVMLIKGSAGSGKSRAARKIEYYLWKQIQVQEDWNNQWIPIHILLPQLKDPKFNLLDQALESENYGFDKLQLKEFKEAILKNTIRVVMILDSYDEMKQDCIQSNLIHTNRLIQELDLSPNNNKVKKAKFIITTRKEILTSMGYQTWFFGENTQTLKEVEILNFKMKQSDQYLEDYVILSIKRRIKFLYDFVKQIKQKVIDIEEFKKIWEKINDQVLKKNDNSDQNKLLDDGQIKRIIKILKENSAFQYVQDDQLTILEKELGALWSVKQYQETIKNLKIEHFKSTPFMLEIVVQTLPNLSKKYNGSNEIKELFSKNYLKLKRKHDLSQKQLKKYSQQIKKNQIEQNKVQQNEVQQNEVQQQQIQKELAQKEQAEIDQDQQNLKSLKILLEQLESLRFFEKYSITDIKSSEDLIQKNIQQFQQNDDLKFVIPALQMKTFTVYEFYQNFIEFYHDQQIQKLRQLGKIENVDSFTIDLIQFSESLALEMTMKQLTQINYEQKGRLQLKNNYFDQNDEGNWIKDYFDDLEDEYRKLVRSSALISLKGKSYSFNHKSIQEFYVAKHINNLINELELKNNQITEKCEKNLEKSLFNNNKFNISFENYAGSFDKLKDKIRMDEQINAKLIIMAKLSKKKKKAFITASSNSFCLLSYLQVYLGDQDFSEIEIEKTTFRGLSFYNTKFKKSILKDVVIDSCLFDEANLEKAEWENLICSEKPKLDGHKGQIIVMQYSNDDKYIITGDSENFIKFWDVQNYKDLEEFIATTGKPFELLLSADDHLLFIAQDNNLIESWIINDLKKIKKTEHIIRPQEKIISLQLSQNEQQLYVVDKSGLIQCWDINQIKENSEVKDGFILQTGEAQLILIQFYSNGELLASYSNDQNIRIWNVEKLEKVDEIKMPSPIQYFIINTDYIACIKESYINNQIIIWDFKNKKWDEQLLSSSKYRINSILFTPDNKQLLYGVEDAVIIQNINDICNQEQYYKLNNCTCIAFSPDQNLIASVNEDQIIFWDLETNAVLNVLENEGPKIQELLFIEKRTELLSYHNGGNLKRWSVQECKLITTYHDCYFHKNITISSDSDMVAIYTKTKTKIAIIRLNQQQFQKRADERAYNEMNPTSISYDDKLFLNGNSIIMPESIENIQFENHNNYFRCGVFSNSSLLFASFSDDQKIRIWTFSDLIFKKNQEIEFAGQISKMAFSFDNKFLALIIEGKNLIKILENNEEKYELEEFIDKNTDLYFSYDNQYLAYFIENEIKIWKFTQDENAQIIQEDEKLYIQAIASSPKINLFASTDCELNIKFWKFDTREQLYKIELGEQVKCLCFSYDGQYLISGGEMLRLWNVKDIYQIKLKGVSEFFCDSQIEKVFSLHETQGITVISNSKMGKILFDQFEFLGILVQSEQVQTAYEFSKDNEFIVGGIEKQVVIWNTKNNFLIKNRYDFEDKIESVRYCQDKKRLVVALKFDIYFLDINSPKKSKVIPNFQFQSITDAQMFDNDQYLYTKQYECVKIWKLQDEPALIDYFSLKNNQIVYSKDGNYLSFYNTDSAFIYPVQRQTKLRLFHFYKLSRIKLSKDSKYILYGNQNQSVLSEFQSEKIIKQFSSYYAFEFCADNQNIIFVGDEKCVIYSIKNEKEIFEIKCKEKLENINYLSFCNNILVLETTCIMVFNLENIQQSYFIGIIQGVKGVANLTTSSTYLASVINKNQIMFTNLTKKKFIKSIHLNEKLQKMNGLVLFSDYQKAAYLENESFKVKNLEEKKIEYYTEDKLKCQVFAISKNKKNIIFSSGKQIFEYVQDTKQHSDFNKLEENIAFLNFSFSQDSQFLVGCGNNKIIYCWDFKARKVIAKFQGHSEQVNIAKISQDNLTVASGSHDKLIRFWNLQENFNRMAQDGHEDQIYHLEFSLDGLILYSSSQDKTLKLWDMQQKILFLSKDFEFGIKSFSISEDQKQFIITQKEKIEFWDIQQNQIMQKLEDKSQMIQSQCDIQQIQYLSNKNKIITLCVDKEKNSSKIEIWDIDKRKDDNPKINQFADPKEITISKLKDYDLKKSLAKQEFTSNDCIHHFSIKPNQNIIALGGKTLYLWNYDKNEKQKVDLDQNQEEIISQVFLGNNVDILVAAKKNKIHLFSIEVNSLECTEIKILNCNESTITCIQIQRDDQIIISVSDDKIIRFWSLKQFSIIAILRGFVETIQKISISPNCTDMAVAMKDGSIRLYNLSFPQNIHDQNSKEQNENYIKCYKIFGRQNLLSAKNCKITDQNKENEKNQLQILFQQKGAQLIKEG
ncbi:unnamed protein product [Paramecium sonneborni]|uniref:NACHT domain-containing protein n=1 Tax=Paramecium sonneborni TaxID=65129 RepID=A0A8S1KV92_9CILI|nr:unnamed protein product [Paramecium sonneborni]